MLEKEYYLPVMSLFFLNFFSFEIYSLFWIFRITKFTNLAKGSTYRDPTKKTLLCIFMPIYFFYWMYKTCQRIDCIAAERGKPSKLTRTYWILFFTGCIIFMPLVIQSKVNKIIF